MMNAAKLTGCLKSKWLSLDSFEFLLGSNQYLNKRLSLWWDNINYHGFIKIIMTLSKSLAEVPKQLFIKSTLRSETLSAECWIMSPWKYNLDCTNDKGEMKALTPSPIYPFLFTITLWILGKTNVRFISLPLQLQMDIVLFSIQQGIPQIARFLRKS